MVKAANSSRVSYFSARNVPAVVGSSLQDKLITTLRRHCLDVKESPPAQPHFMTVSASLRFLLL